MLPARTLVLSVDRDDDIGFKADIISPVIGREGALNAAIQLALADPEDSDVNAIFQTIKIFDELKEKGEDVEIAVISGNHLHMIEGDRKIAESLEEVVEKTGATHCILVADGAEDEFILPIIQSRMMVTSVRRVIVNQIPNLEGTYYIIKKVISDPKFSRFALIPLGLAMLLYAASYYFGYPQVATIIVVGAIGTYLLYRGLGLDENVHEFVDGLRVQLSRGRFSFVTYVAGIIIIAIGIIMGMMSVVAHAPSGSFGLLLYIMSFLYGAIEWFVIAGILMSLGTIVDNFFYERENMPKVVIYPFFLSAVGLIAFGASTYVLSVSKVAQFPVLPEEAFQYILYGTIAGLICAFIGVAFQLLLNRWIHSGNHTDVPN